MTWDELIEETLGSRGRIRILRVLARRGQVNMSRLARECGLSYESTKSHVDRLRELGLVDVRRVGRVVLIRISDHPLSVMLRDILLGPERIREGP
ncbi:MAG: MarR family transcriptional regulator [Candidatus Korarchaeota archaeon]|nr:MarR family transcriptional regulator [Candidatus Korarchaeota archaeon]